MDEISLHLCGDIMPILKVSPVLFVSSIKVLLFFFFFSISKCDSSIWGLSTTDPVFPPRFLLDWNLLYFSHWPWSQGCWGGADVIAGADALMHFFNEIGRWVECATRVEASFLVLSTPHFSPLLPATETLPYLWDTAPIEGLWLQVLDLQRGWCRGNGPGGWATRLLLPGFFLACPIWERSSRLL